MKPELADAANAVDVLESTSFTQQPIAPGAAVNDSAWTGSRSVVRRTISRFAGWFRSLGPYVAIELILPGGSIIALALWTYRNRAELRRRIGSAQVKTPAIPVPAFRLCRCTGR